MFDFDDAPAWLWYVIITIIVVSLLAGVIAVLGFIYSSNHRVMTRVTIPGMEPKEVYNILKDMNRLAEWGPEITSITHEKGSNIFMATMNGVPGKVPFEDVDKLPPTIDSAGRVVFGFNAGVLQAKWSFVIDAGAYNESTSLTLIEEGFIPNVMIKGIMVLTRSIAKCSYDALKSFAAYVNKSDKPLDIQIVQCIP